MSRIESWGSAVHRAARRPSLDAVSARLCRPRNGLLDVKHGVKRFGCFSISIQDDRRSSRFTLFNQNSICLSIVLILIPNRNEIENVFALLFWLRIGRHKSAPVTNRGR